MFDAMLVGSIAAFALQFAVDLRPFATDSISVPAHHSKVQYTFVDICLFVMGGQIVVFVGFVINTTTNKDRW